MPCNLGNVERSIRILLGILLLGIGAFAGLSAVATAVLLIAGTIALVTGAVSFCPLWALLGLNTCAAHPAAKH
ncbi:MAG TPA: DUF2892 domain-containing protein [Nitrospira sp.]|nr:DUF2892 domain-containing protein [Nitrospira sp.]